MTNIYVDRFAQDGAEFRSSNIDLLGYDRESKTLYVEFQSGGQVYSYQGVEESTYNLLVDAPSVGSFYANHIKGNFTGESFDASHYITLRDEPVVTPPAPFKVGDRVMVKWDDPGKHYWDGPATVQYIVNDIITVRPDHLDRDGGFYKNNLTLIEDGGEQGDVKWLTGSNPITGETEVDTLLASVVEPSRWGVKWQALNAIYVGIPSTPMQPVFDALSEADALAQFEEQVAATGTILGTHIEYKILEVTHYFD